MFSRSIAPLLIASLALGACAAEPASNDDAVESAGEEIISGPGRSATDQRVPELGKDLSVVNQSKISMADGLSQAGKDLIEAKFELGDDGKLSLSIYPAKNGLSKDSERNVFQELSGDPTATPFAGKLETFDDDEHVLRSSRDLTLVQLSRLSLADAVKRSESMGNVFWAIPTIRDHRAGYGVYALDKKGKQTYRFVDGQGSDESSSWWCLHSLGSGPGAAATDERTPELGDDLTVVRQSKLSMATALAQMEAKHGPAIEAKFELGDDGKLSLSIYPVGKGVKTDAERNEFFELAGDPTAAKFEPEKSQFKMPDFEHVSRSARDLTLVQTAGLTLREAVRMVDIAQPGGFVYWAIPTIRGTRAGYGVYTLGKDNKAHYYFVS